MAHLTISLSSVYKRTIIPKITEMANDQGCTVYDMIRRIFNSHYSITYNGTIDRDLEDAVNAKIGADAARYDSRASMYVLCSNDVDDAIMRDMVQQDLTYHQVIRMILYPVAGLHP